MNELSAIPTKVQIQTNKLAWMVVQCSPKADQDGMWTPLMPEDLPDWVKDPAVMGRMFNGDMVCLNPERGTLWYRAVRMDPPVQH